MELIFRWESGGDDSWPVYWRNWNYGRDFVLDIPLPCPSSPETGETPSGNWSRSSGSKPNFRWQNQVRQKHLNNEIAGNLNNVDFHVYVFLWLIWIIYDFFSMPYTEAVINETLRKSSNLPIGLPHFTSENTKLSGYDLPKVITKFPPTINSWMLLIYLELNNVFKF